MIRNLLRTLMFICVLTQSELVDAGGISSRSGARTSGGSRYTAPTTRRTPSSTTTTTTRRSSSSRSSSGRSGYYYTYSGPYVAGRYGYSYYGPGGTVVIVNYGSGQYYYDY